MISALSAVSALQKSVSGALIISSGASLFASHSARVTVWRYHAASRRTSAWIRLKTIMSIMLDLRHTMRLSVRGYSTPASVESAVEPRMHH